MFWISGLFAATIVPQACSVAPRLDPPPQHLAVKSLVIDTPQARFYPDEQAAEMFEEGVHSREKEMRALGLTDPAEIPPASFLAISGGSDEGAFGAGLLVGWSDAGTRPEFKLVTGVSTGALIAPLAFLGTDYDNELREIYTTMSAETIFKKRNISAALFGDALFDSAPLFELISGHMDDEMLAAIATEYGKGRLLLIGTTNLDARRGVIWNIGAIAASGHSGALDLVRKILLASAAIPGAFPPVIFDVTADGKRFQEMHVDGGVIAQLFLYPPQVGQKIREAGIVRDRRAFIIRNARIARGWSEVRRRTLDVASEAIATMIHSSGLNDLFRVYVTAQLDGVDYNLALIENDFSAAPKSGQFDRAYMNALFNYGYDKALNGYPWRKAPPFLVAGKR